MTTVLEDLSMVDVSAKIPVMKEEIPPAPTERWGSLMSPRGEVDRLFDDFAWRWPVDPFRWLPLQQATDHA
jgi:hypothetical protein